MREPERRASDLSDNASDEAGAGSIALDGPYLLDPTVAGPGGRMNADTPARRGGPTPREFERCSGPPLTAPRACLTGPAAVAVVTLLLAASFAMLTSAPVAEARLSTAEGRSALPARASGALLPAAGASLTILPDGALSDPSAPVEVRGETYTILSDYNGTIADERNGSVLEGAGHKVLAGAAGAAAIDVSGTSGVVVANLTTVGGTTGLRALGVSDLTVRATDLTSTTVGLTLSNSSRVILEGVATDGVAQGLSASAVQGLSLTGSRISATEVGVDVMQSAALTIAQCDLTGAGRLGVRLVEVAGADLIGNDVDATPGAAVTGVSALRVSQLNLTGNSANGTETGFLVVQSDSVAARGNVLEGVSVGFDLTRDSYLTIVGNDVSHARLVNGTAVAVRIVETLEFNVSDNDLTASAGSGLEIAWGTHGTVVGNNVSWATRAGISMSASHNVQMGRNHADDIRAPGGIGYNFSANGRLDFVGNSALRDDYGLVDASSNRLWVIGSDLSFPITRGVSIVNDRELQVRSSTFSGSPTADHGLYVADSIGVVLSGNALRDFVGAALLADRDSEIQILSNAVTGTAAAGIVVNGSADVSVGANTVTNASGAGLVLDHVLNFTVAANVVSGAPVGLDVNHSLTGTLADNQLSYNALGAIESGDTGVTWTSNDFLSNDRSLSFSPGAEVSVFHNNFVADAGVELPGRLAASPYWDDGYPVGGNYWSNWTGPDVESGPAQSSAGSDGLVDAPVLLGGGWSDRYPLAQPWNLSAVTFSEQGLPDGVGWGVLFNGIAYATKAASIAIPETNGAYTTFSYAAVSPPGYRALNGSGHGLMHHLDLAVSIAFTTSSILYDLTFASTGLPTGTPWSVAVDGATREAVGGLVTAAVANGTHSYAVEAVPGFVASPSQGTVTVAGADVAVAVSFTPAVFPVLVVAVGLAGGAPWTITVDGVPYVGTASVRSLALANGTHAFVVTGAAGSAPVPRAGTIEVAGAPLSLTVTFLAVTYPATVELSPLPAGAEWTLVLGGRSYVSAAPALTVTLANGTYDYDLLPPTGFTVLPSTGSFTVAGSAVVVSAVLRAVTYAVTFTEQGLPAGYVWVVTLDGVDHVVLYGSLEVRLSNGSHGFQAFASGYRASPDAGTVVVDGAGATVAIAFVGSASTAVSLAGPPTGPVVALVLGVAAVGFLAAFALARLGARRARRAERRDGSRLDPDAREDPRRAARVRPA